MEADFYNVEFKVKENIVSNLLFKERINKCNLPLEEWPCYFARIDSQAEHVHQQMAYYED